MINNRFIKLFFILIVIFVCVSLSADYVSDWGDLQIVNNTLSDKNGNPVQLKGFSQLDLMAWDTSWVPGSTIPNLVALTGCNAVRIAMYTSENGQGYMDGVNQNAYKNRVIALIDDAIAAGIYIQIDWHILNDGDPWSTTYRNAARSFFEYIAQQRGGYDNVLFELCNEPKAVSFKDTIKPYAEYVLAGIRNYSDNIAVVGTQNWSQYVDDVVGKKITNNVGRGIMYSLHFYAATHYDDLRNRGNTALAGGVPVMLSEWGTVSASGDGSTDYYNSGVWLDWANANNISWFNWSWSIRSETSAAIANGSLSGPWTYPNDLTSSGQWVYGRLPGGGSTPTPAPTQPPGSIAVTLYSDCGYNGNSASFGVGDYVISDIVNTGLLNDDLSSFVLADGYKITLYEHDYYAGSSVEFASSKDCLVNITTNRASGDWNDDISSFKVEATGSSGGIVSGQTYVIKAKNSGKCLDVSGVSTDDGANIHQWTYGGGNNQKWIVTDVGSGQWKIVAVHSGKCLDVDGFSTADGGNVHQWSYHGGSNQKWTITAVETGYYKIINVNSGKCLDVSGVSTADGANIHQWSYVGGDNQKWSFTAP